MTRRAVGLGVGARATATAVAALIALAGSGGGCSSGASGAAGTDVADGVAPPPARGGAPSPALAPPRTRPGGLVPGLDRGLRSWQWRIDEAALDAPLGAVLASVAVPPPASAVVEPEVAERLARNGLRLLAVPREDLDRLRTLLVLPSLQVETWHGEASDWRPLAVAVPGAGGGVRGGGGGGAAVAIGGRMRRFPSGSFRLAVRAWTMRMEDGPHLQVELRVEHLEPARDRGLLAGRARPVARLVDGLALELAAPPDLAWVIAPAPPNTAWPAPGTPLAADAAGQDDRRDPRGGGEGSARTLGPPALPVTTVGELLLTRRGAPASQRTSATPGDGAGAENGRDRPGGRRIIRELLVLEPELPRILFPEPPRDAADRAEAGSPGGGGPRGELAPTERAAAGRVAVAVRAAEGAAGAAAGSHRRRAVPATPEDAP